MNEGEIIPYTRPQRGSDGVPAPEQKPSAPAISFDRHELRLILNIYGRMVSQGEWRDYALSFLPDRAVFSIYRRASEVALYRVEKRPELRNRQGLYCVVSATGLILKRGHELERVLRVLDKRLTLVD